MLGSVFCVLTIALVCGLLYSSSQTIELVSLLPVTFVAVGKFLPLWAVTGQSHFSAWELAAVIWLLDTVSVIVIVYGLEGLYRFGALKRALDRIHNNVGLVLRAYPRIRRTAAVGVVLFVLFPIAGTGAIGATFLGILLRLHRLTLIAAVSLGGFLGGALMAFLAVNFSSVVMDWQHSPTAKYAGIAAFVTVIVFIVVWTNRAHRRALKQAEQGQSPTQL